MRQSPFKCSTTEGFHLAVDLLARRDTWLLEMPAMPMALTRSSTERVEMPYTLASWMTAVSALSAIRRASRKAGK